LMISLVAIFISIDFIDDAIFGFCPILEPVIFYRKILGVSAVLP
jgi:hypothetical protein